MKKIKVLSVDDSALMRKIMSDIVNCQPDMSMVAVAPDPLAARDLIKQHNPDVLTLDVEMPHMDGLDFLERLMRLRPMPVIMVSSLTRRNSDVTLCALELGAVDFVPKPQLNFSAGLDPFADAIAEKIRIAAQSKLQHQTRQLPPPAPLFSRQAGSKNVIALGSSTGGTEALRQILLPLPQTSPALLIAQHMPPGFTRSFAGRLDRLCQIRVREAVDGEPVLPGHAYIAPGGLHMMLAQAATGYRITLSDAPPVNRHRPSVDRLFQSVARVAGKQAVGVILTGMGNDGAQGLAEMRQAGAWTLAQSEKSCVVYGMPREAIALGAACDVVDLDQISERMLRAIPGQIPLR
ncbi:protein-glutamate methylesterase/protein-glutamine glutaminase [[Erwinia] mediterraneensis]|uniref:protein-glutamate methylesterase/protein-glutamine glutaminase n=1 Tax=[Erwinia] mediterraneensis TaxID=2161819 RepID=UPI00102FC4AD|nr:chemotaxis response regulator protein-glutamate methylesterase [[Erwinia] mediterraneensis]